MLKFSNEFIFPTNLGVELDVDFFPTDFFQRTCLPTQSGRFIYWTSRWLIYI